MVSLGSYVGPVEVFTFAPTSVLVGRPISSSVCMFCRVTSLPLSNGDWLHIKGKRNVIDGDRPLGKKDPPYLVTVGRACVGT